MTRLSFGFLPNLISSSNGKTVAATAGWVSLPRGHSCGTSQPAAHPPPAPNTAHSLCTLVHSCAPGLSTRSAHCTMCNLFHGRFFRVERTFTCCATPCTSFGAVFSIDGQTDQQVWTLVVVAAPSSSSLPLLPLLPRLPHPYHCLLCLMLPTSSHPFLPQLLPSLPILTSASLCCQPSLLPSLPLFCLRKLGY